VFQPLIARHVSGDGGISPENAKWECTRMPFGLKGAGNTFIRAVQTIVQPIRDHSDSYVDDLATLMIAKPLVHFRRFLEVMRRTGPGNLLQATISGKSHTLLSEDKKKSFEPDAVPGRQISHCLFAGAAPQTQLEKVSNRSRV